MKLRTLKCKNWCRDCKAFDWGTCENKYALTTPKEYYDELYKDCIELTPDTIIDTDKYAKQVAFDFVNNILDELNFIKADVRISELNITMMQIIKSRIYFYKQVINEINKIK